MYVDSDTVRFLWPEVILVLIASWMYLGSTIQSSRAWWTVFSLAAYAVAAYVIVWKEGAYWSATPQFDLTLSGPIVVDYLGYVFRCLALLVGVLFTLLASRGDRRELAGEYLGTLMLLVVGIMLVARANDLVLLFVSLELISIPTYVLLYLGRRDRTTAEATAKYFFLSVLSSALLLYGLSFLYGMTGTTALIGSADQPGIRDAGGLGGGLAGLADSEALSYLALVLIVAGLGFKIAAVPFHFYAPDVYQGATHAHAGLLAIAPKIAGILALVRLLVVGFPQAAAFAWQLSLVLAILTMTLGNVCALWQQNLRRLMAYSSIAHAGYMLIGLAAAFAATQAISANAGGIAATLFYVFVYALASLGTFAALALLGTDEREVNSVEELCGLGSQRPVIAAAIAICMFSLAGIPPLAGFWGKLTLFFSAIETAAGSPDARISLWFTLLAVAGALNAAVAAAYYLRVVAVMYFRPARETLPARGGWGAAIAMSVCVLLLVGVGVFPRAPLQAARKSEALARPGLSALPPALPVRLANRGSAGHEVRKRPPRAAPSRDGEMVDD